jgi:hypothetical protein
MRMRFFGIALLGAVVLAGCDGQGGQHRGEYRAACGADIQTYCPTATSRDERRTCVDTNKEKFSEGCKTYMAAHPWHGRDREGEQGSEGQAPANP